QPHAQVHGHYDMRLRPTYHRAGADPVIASASHCSGEHHGHPGCRLLLPIHYRLVWQSIYHIAAPAFGPPVYADETMKIYCETAASSVHFSKSRTSAAKMNCRMFADQALLDIA